MTTQAIADICLAHLGTSKAHATRHTFAHTMEQVGAKVSDIQARLGHSNLQTTGEYLAALHSAYNPHAEELAALFGAEIRREDPMSEQESPPAGPHDRQVFLKRATTLKQQIEDCKTAGNLQQAGMYRRDFMLLLRRLTPEDANLVAWAVFGDKWRL